MNAYRHFCRLTRIAMTFAAVAAVAFQANASTAATSRLASGRWVKIKLTESGIHQITFDQLRQWGFSNPAKVGVFGFPAVELSSYHLTADRLNDLPAVPCRVADDKIIFFGLADVNLQAFNGNLPTGYDTGTYTSVSRNYYADYGTYFLTDSQPAQEIATIAYSGPETSGGIPSQAITESKAMSLYEKELQSEKHLGARLWDELIPEGSTATYPLEMPGFNPDGGQAEILMYVGHCASSQSQYVPITLPSGHLAANSLYLSKQNSAEMWLYGQSRLLHDNTTDHPIVRAEGDVYPLLFTNTLPGGRLTIDYISTLYPTRNALAGRSQAVFTLSDLTASSLLAFEGNEGEPLEVWDVTTSTAPRAFTTSGVEGTASVVVSSPGSFSTSNSFPRQFARIVVFNPESELLGVEFDGEVDNQNLHAMPVPDMLIVTASEFLDQATRLADIHHAHNGLDVAVVTQEQVYNEFSSGTPMIMALRSFASSLYERDPAKFRSVLIIGAAHWDNRYITVDNADECRRNYVPMFLCERGDAVGSWPQSYKTDAFVGMLDYNSSTLDMFNTDMKISVGRIPAISGSYVASYIDKVEKYLANLPSPEIYNTVLVSSDWGNSNGHMKQADELATDIEALAPGTTAIKAHNSIYPFVNSTAAMVTGKMTDALTRGIGLFTFNGHSLSTFALGAGSLWDVSKVASTSYTVPPFVMFATCNGIEPSQTSHSISEAMLSERNGGAIGVIAACRSVFMNYNQYLAREVVEKVYLKRPNPTTGTVMMDAHNGLIDDLNQGTTRNRAMANRLAYNLYGDPEIPIPQRTHGVRLTAVNGAEVDPDSEVSVNADTPVRLEGVVVDLKGNEIKDFNGTLHISLYDSPISFDVINGDKTDLSLGDSSVLDEELLVETMATVEGGRFHAEFFVPSPRFQSTNRLQFYARAGETIVSDGWKGLSVLQPEAASPDIEGAAAPVISAMYVNSPDFCQGDVVQGPSATLYASVDADPFGLIAQSSSAGRSAAVIVDGGIPVPYAQYSFSIAPDGSGSLVFPLSNLTDGHHSVTFRVSNASGLTARSTIDFTVVSQPLEATLSVEEYPVRESATINLDCNVTDPVEGHLVVKDAQGRPIVRVDNPSFPYVWNLTDAGGNAVAAGLYTVEAYIRTGRLYGSAKPVQLVVHY